MQNTNNEQVNKNPATEDKSANTPISDAANTSRNKGFFFKSILIPALMGAVFGIVFSYFTPKTVEYLEETWSLGSDTSTDSSTMITPPEALLDEDATVIEVVNRTTPAVVSVVVTQEISSRQNFFNSPFDFFFDDPFGQKGNGDTERRQVGGGTGFFVSTDGMIVTNKHVVANENAQYTVLTQDGTEYEAEVLARDPIRDIALIQIEGAGFEVLPLGDSSSIKVGQTVIAIGNSLGEFSNSVSKGIVSGLQRDIIAGSGFGQSERLTDIIQTDAAINPGNSGGPLLDIHGRVIGINTAIAQGAENVGFALPINSVKNIIDQVKETGEISVPFLGVRYVIINEAIQEANDLPFDYGALLLRGENITDLAVMPGSPADRVGLVENDIILEVDGERVTQENPLNQILSNYDVGDNITLTVWQRGEENEVTVELGERSS